MKIKIGEIYKSSNSNTPYTYKIVFEDNSFGKFPFIGIQFEDNKPTERNFFFNESGQVSHGTFDLRPIPRVLNLKLNDLYKWVAQDYDGSWFLFTQTPRLSGAIWVSDGTYIRMPKELAPKWNCDYKDSLTQL